MIRSGSYFPGHPVFRRLPFCRHDYLIEQAYARRVGAKTEAQKAALEVLLSERLKMGVTCNKYKEKSSKLTAGLFTVFCLGCSVCVGFEMMEDPESPATPFRIFAHRAWTSADFRIREQWLRHGIWDDSVVDLPSSMRGL